MAKNKSILCYFEQTEKQKEDLVKALKKGEKSGFVKNFDREIF
jgi:hypothetical protein